MVCTHVLYVYMEYIVDTIHVFAFYFKGAVVGVIAEVYSIQYYEIKFASSSSLLYVASFSGVSIFDCPFVFSNVFMLQIGCFVWVLQCPPTNNMDRHEITEILLKVALNTITAILLSQNIFINRSINCYVYVLCSYL